MNTQILSAHTGQPVNVLFAMVGKGKALHYSPSNDETLCGKAIREYVSGTDHTDAPLCKVCARIERVRSDEYAAWLESQETAVVEPVSESMGDESTDATADVQTDAQSFNAPHTGTRDCPVCPGSDTRFMTDAEKAEAFACVESAQTKQDADFQDMANAPESDWMYRGLETSQTDAQSVSGGTVIVQGAEGFDMIPEMSELVDGCYFGCGRPVTGMWCDYVGRTEGVCDLDRDKLGDHITVYPVDPAIWGGKGDDVATVAVIQNRAGMNGRTHYHAPGCRDIAREMRHWGQKSDDVMEASFSSVAEILAFEYGDIASDSTEENTPEWWAEILHNATIDQDSEIGFGVKIMGCLDIPQGRAGNGPLVSKGGFYRVGFDQPTAERRAEIRAEIDAHECDETDCITCIVRDMNREEIPSVEEFPNERAYKSGTENARDYARDNGFTEYGEEWQTVFRSSYALSMEIQAEENASDGGFVETLVTKEYELSVIVDDVTGTRVSLGWVTLTMNAAQAMDFDRVAEEYGRTQNTRTPRHGWASIIRVHDVADI